MLAVEVADTSIRKDRECKSKLHAKAGIEDYWIVNLIDSCVEVYRRPRLDSKQGPIYLDRKVYYETESISALGKPDAAIKVADMLP